MDDPGAGNSPGSGESPGTGEGQGSAEEPGIGGSPGSGENPGTGDGQGGAEDPGAGNSPESGVALTGAAALQEYLDGQAENTAANPYRIRLAGINLASKAAGNTLKGFYLALSRYAALDLSGSYGEKYINIDLETIPNKGKITEIILPPGLHTVEKNAFAKCAELVSADLSKATTLEHGVFSRCVKLETLVMDEVREIEYTSDSAEGAFHNCDSLVSVSLPKVVNIGKKTFNSCDALATVYAPQAAIIGDSAFAGCKNLAYLYLGETPPELGEAVFAKGKPEIIYVPSSSINTYKNTSVKGWTDDLKAKAQALP
jgi:hypothetical protein